MFTWTLLPAYLHPQWVLPTSLNSRSTLCLTGTFKVIPPKNAGSLKFLSAPAWKPWMGSCSGWMPPSLWSSLWPALRESSLWMKRWRGIKEGEGMLKQTFQVKLARLELLFQTDHWGSVEWAHDIEEFDTTARLAAATLFVQLSSTETKTRNKQPQMWYFSKIFDCSQNTSKVILIWSSEMSKRNSSAVARLKQDYIRLKKDPVLQSTCLFHRPMPNYFRNLQVPYIVAEPLPSNLLEWHYVVR